MKFNFKKVMLTMIPLTCISIGGVMVSAKGIVNNVKETKQQTRAVSSIKIKGDGNKLGYLNASTGDLVYFPSKTTDTYGVAYCTNRTATTPPKTWTTYTLSGGEQSKKALYAMEYDSGIAHTNAEYYVRSMGVHYAYGEYSKVMNQSGVTENYAGVKAKSQGLAKILDSGNFRTTQDVTTSLNTSALTFTKNGNYYDSNWVTLNVNQPSGLDFSPTLIESIVNVSGAPSGTQVMNQAGYVATNNNIGTYRMFHLRIPASSYSANAKITASVSTKFEVGAAYLYTNSGYQPMAVRGTKNITVNSGSATSKVSGIGGLRVVAKDVDGNLLPGSSYQVMDGNISITGVQTTDSTGETIFTGIPAGNYTLVNTAFPYTHLGAASAPVTVSANVNNRKTMIHDIARGNLQVLKKDENGNPLQGAVFRVEKGDKVIAGPLTTDSNGQITFYDLPVGYADLVEVSPPPGYSIIEAEREKVARIDWTATNRAHIINRKSAGGVRVYVDDSADARRLPGAEVKLYDSNGREVATGITDLSGIAYFDNVPLGVYKVRQTKAPKGYFINDTVYTTTVEVAGAVANVYIANNRQRDFSMPAYNVKDTSGNMVGTLTKNKSYSFNVKIKSEMFDLVLPEDTIYTSPPIDKFKYAIAVNDGSINQDVSSITTSNIKGTIVSSGTRTGITIRDLSEIWQKIEFTTPNNDSYSEIVFVIEIEATRDANSSNNKLVVKIPIVNDRKDEIFIDNMELYPTTSEGPLVGNDINVKLDLSSNSLKTYNVTTKIKVEGPSGYGTKTFTKPAYGISLEESGSVYFKFKPTASGTYTISAECSIPGSSKTTQKQTVKVIHPGEPREYLTSTQRTKTMYDTGLDIKTYVKVKKRDKDLLNNWKHEAHCQEDENGNKTCPGHSEWTWGAWYDAFIPRKSTKMTGVEENYNITEVKFRSKLTEDNAKRYPRHINPDGYVSMLNTDSAKYAQVKAGYGFEMQMETKYTNNLPTVFNKASVGNTVPSNSTWSEYKTIAYSGSKIPFVYADIHGDSEVESVDEQVKTYSGAVSVAVPSLSDLIIESPNQIYVKLPDPSGEYYMVNEGYGARYSDEKIKDGLIMSNTSGIKISNTEYSETKVFEFKKNNIKMLDKRGYYVSKEVSDGVRTLSVYNRYAGYGINKKTRLHDKKDVAIKISGGRYDDVKDSE